MLALLLTNNYLFKTNYSFQFLIILFTQSGAVIFLRELFNRHLNYRLKNYFNFSKKGTFDVLIIHRVGVVSHSILVLHWLFPTMHYQIYWHPCKFVHSTNLSCWRASDTQKRKTEHYERRVFHHIRYEYSSCTSRIECALNTLWFYSVTYILLDVLLCSIAEYFYELYRILASP